MRKTSNNNIGEILGNWFVKYAKIIMPVVLVVAVIITVVIAVRANKNETETQEDVEANITLEDTADEPLTVPEVALQENDNPEIEELMNKYYTAQAAGDIDTLRTLIDNIDDTEILRIKETSKYVESYPTLDIYTKTGPIENTYLVFICTETKFTDYEDPIPGMRVWFVCADENGRYYINESDGTEAELNYIREVCLQDDVVDLNNKVTVAYNDMLAADADLAQFILDVNTEIEKNVGEALLAQAEESGESEQDADNTEAGEEGTGNSDTETVVTKVRATDVVNIRSSDSETADKVGKAAIGDEFKLIEKIGNGWSRIEYEGKDAYIKSDYLEAVETTEVASNDAEATDNQQETSTNTSSDNSGTVTGTVTAKQSVKIRSSASTDSEALGTAYAGAKLDLIVKQADGWTRIKYKGKIAFVKSDYVE